MKRYIVSRIRDDEDEELEEEEELTDKEKIKRARKDAQDAYNLLVECKNYLKDVETPVDATIDESKKAIQKTAELSNMIDDDSIFEDIFGTDDSLDDSLDNNDLLVQGVDKLVSTLKEYGATDIEYNRYGESMLAYIDGQFGSFDCKTIYFKLNDKNSRISVIILKHPVKTKFNFGRDGYYNTPKEAVEEAVQFLTKDDEEEY